MVLRYFLSMAFVFALSVGSAFAQGSVNGIVKDRSGKPLVGADVIVKGTTISTITGPTGEFIITAPADAFLVISYDGYQAMEVAVADLGKADLQLIPESLINIGAYYGNDNYYALTTASTLIIADDVSTGLETDIQDFLLGQVPGLDVIDGQYRLRGGNSLTGWDEVQPLFVVDGAYEFCTDMIIGALNPADIESIRVLKDAAATAQYGMLAKGGAIVIKTRHPSDKTLTVNYDGNASLNTPSGDDSKWEPYNSSFDNSFSTKHNLSVSGLAGLLPYRASLGYNAENGILENYNSDRYSASLWVGPRLFDKHLSIDANGAYRNLDINYDSYDLGSQWLSGTINTDYAVHGFELLHLNIKANAITSLDDYKASMVDGYASFQHQFGKRHYLELRAGTAFGKAESEYDKMSFKSVYGQFNMAISRFFMNAYTRYNNYSFENEAFGKLSSSVSFGVKPANVVTLRTGFGLLGIAVGDQPKGVSDLSAFTYNLGVDVGSLKNRINGSADFFFHHHRESPADGYNIEDDAILNNLGAEFKIDAKIIDRGDVKLRVGGTLSCVVGIDFENDDNNSDDDDARMYISIGGYMIEEESGNIVRVKPHTYGVYDPVYDQDGNRIPGMYVDHDGDGRLSNGDYISSKCSPVPSVLGGFHAYLEVKGAYLQLNAHASLDRHNVSFNSNSNDDDDDFVWRELENWSTSYSYWDSEIVTTDNIHNSSFLRIDNIVLGYKIPNWGKAYFAVRNPYVFTKYDSCEPEIYNGYDNNFALRRPTTFSVGLKLNINIKD